MLLYNIRSFPRRRTTACAIKYNNICIILQYYRPRNLRLSPRDVVNCELIGATDPLSRARESEGGRGRSTGNDDVAGVWRGVELGGGRRRKISPADLRGGVYIYVYVYIV